ncbi:F-box protein [Achlya hypogyna]|uniref:F-box protein n=1 Tax=Achlya hypogyna TaxID=1202772 RepID=A0A1V9Z0X2_ACHHY|nr:F-box protein [Achlya hypogyna]
MAKRMKTLFSDAWPAELEGQITQYLDHNDLHSFEASCKRFQTVTRLGGCWRRLVSRSVVFPLPPGVASDVDDWKALSCANHIIMANKADTSSLLHGVAGKILHVAKSRSLVGVSSVDRNDAENPANTLQPSLCFREMTKYEDDAVRQFSQDRTLFDYTIQRLVCGCSMGQCYWSSAPTANPSCEDTIDYTVRGSCIIRGVQIVPYRAFWQLGQPTYAPVQISISILASRGEPPIYTSPLYDIRNTMELQAFELPQNVYIQSPMWLVRLTLHGKHQYELETPDEDADGEELEQRRNYYCCLSFVGLTGGLH